MNAAIEMVKCCTKCGETKLREEFYPDSRGGRRASCKACHNAQVSRRRRTPEGREVARRGIAMRRSRSPRQAWIDYAHDVVRVAVRSGRLKSASETPCSRKGPDCSGRHELHHDSYLVGHLDKVRCLCEFHHRQVHAEATPPMPPRDELDAWLARRRVKRCARCEAKKPTKEFVGHPGTKDGLGSYCRDCRRAYQQRYREQQQARRAARGAVR